MKIWVTPLPPPHCCLVKKGTQKSTKLGECRSVAKTLSWVTLLWILTETLSWFLNRYIKPIYNSIGLPKGLKDSGGSKGGNNLVKGVCSQRWRGVKFLQHHGPRPAIDDPIKPTQTTVASSQLHTDQIAEAHIIEGENLEQRHFELITHSSRLSS